MNLLAIGRRDLKSTMRTPAERAAPVAFIDAATSDADPGYPHGAAFIPWQETRQTDRVLWRYLHEGRPAVMVGTEDFDMLIEPIQTSHVAQLRNVLLQRIAVKISFRRRGNPTATDIPPLRADIGRHVLRRRHPQRPRFAVPNPR